jgi:hypothetical protein
MAGLIKERVARARWANMRVCISNRRHPMDERSDRSAKDQAGASDMQCGLIAVMIVIVVIVGAAIAGTKPDTAPAANVAAQP